MTAYWPTSAVTAKLTQQQRAEIARAYIGISWPTMRACHKAASNLPADLSLIIIDSEGVGMRMIKLNSSHISINPLRSSAIHCSKLGTWR